MARPAKAPSNVVKLSLVPKKEPEVNLDTMNKLAKLLGMAAAGAIDGLVFVAFCPDETYFTDILGQAYTNPTWARGALSYVDDELGRLIDAAGEAAPTFEW